MSKNLKFAFKSTLNIIYSFIEKPILDQTFKNIMLALFCTIATACSKQDIAKISTDKVNTATPYVLDNTEVRNIHAKYLHRDYQLFISLPESYLQQPKRKFPVLFITDANYAFPLVRSIAKRISDHGKNLNDFILIGLSYAKGDTPIYSRNRDYTPTIPTECMDTKTYSTSNCTSGSIYGQADDYRKFIKDEIFPFVAQNYRADMTRKIYAGHSYGGLLGIQILLTDPSMFNYYIVGSPSLWFDHNIMFKYEKNYINTHSDIPANVFMAVGSYETINPKSKDKRYNTQFDMVRDLNEFAQILKLQHYPNLKIKTQVIPDEDHLTVFPAIITRGLQFALSKES